MTRETKVGLVVASSFICLVGVVVASKIRPGDSSVSANSAEANQVATAGKDNKDPKKGESGKTNENIPGLPSPEGNKTASNVAPAKFSAPASGLDLSGLPGTPDKSSKQPKLEVNPPEMKIGPGSLSLPVPNVEDIQKQNIPKVSFPPADQFAQAEPAPVPPPSGFLDPPGTTSKEGTNPSPFPGDKKSDLAPPPPDFNSAPKPVETPKSKDPTAPSPFSPAPPEPKGAEAPTPFAPAPTPTGADPTPPPFPPAPNSGTPNFGGNNAPSPPFSVNPPSPSNPPIASTKDPTPFVPGKVEETPPPPPPPTPGNKNNSPFGSQPPVTPPAKVAFPGKADEPTKPGTVPPLGVDPPPLGTAGINPGLPQVKIFDVQKYTLQPGDNSFAAVSKRVYSDEKFGTALQEYNREYQVGDEGLRMNPPRLEVGKKVLIPPVAHLESKYAALINKFVSPKPAAPFPFGQSADVGFQPATAAGNPQPPLGISPPAPLGSTPTLGQNSSAPIGLAPSPMGFGNPGPGPLTVRTTPTTDSTRRYRVREQGQHILEIARQTLGDGGRWSEIYRLNPTVQPQYPIPGGTELKLPANAVIP